MRIEGTAHPPPGTRGGLGAADMCAAEIRAEDMGGQPLLEEHDRAREKGQCIASWAGVDGSLRVEAVVTDPDLKQKIRTGKSRGLSLGTEMILVEGANC